MASNTDLAKKLAETSVSVLVADQKLITLAATDTVSKAFAVLLENGILSAPVLDEQTQEYIGIVDCIDLLEQVVKAYPKATLMHLNSFSLFHQKNQHCATIPASQIIELSQRNNFLPLKPTASVLDLIDHIVKHNLRRVPLVDEKNVLTAYVTQSDIVRFVIQKAVPAVDSTFSAVTNGCIPLLNEIAVNGVNHTVESVKDTTLAIEAFAVMTEKKLSALPIVNEDNVLLGCISASDIRHVGKTPMSFALLYSSVMEYISPIRMEHMKAVHPVLSVRHTDTLGSVMGKLAAVRTHRLYMVDDDGRLDGVVSLTDVVNVLSSLATTA